MLVGVVTLGVALLGVALVGLWAIKIFIILQKIRNDYFLTTAGGQYYRRG
jgi:hypothetical protein